MKLQCQKDADQILVELLCDLIENYRTASNHNRKEFLYGQMLGVLTSFISLGLIEEYDSDPELKFIIDKIASDIDFERECGY